MINDAVITMINKLIEIEKNEPIKFAYIRGRVDSLIKNTDTGIKFDVESVIFESR